MQAILFDLDGVIYQGAAPVAGALETLDWVQREGIPHRFLTNTTSRPRVRIVERLAAMGASVDASLILTPAVAAADWLHRRGVARIAPFVATETRGEFGGFELLPDDREQGADAVVIGDLGEGWDFRTLNRAFRLLMADPRPHLVALGMTRYWQAADGLRLDTGPFVAALQQATGCEPVVLGKPARPFFDAALAVLGTDPGETLMVGDDIRGDIHAAKSVGLKGLLVRTGKFRAADLMLTPTPDWVLDSVADLPQWWARHGLDGT